MRVIIKKNKIFKKYIISTILWERTYSYIEGIVSQYLPFRIFNIIMWKGTKDPFQSNAISNSTTLQCRLYYQ